MTDPSGLDLTALAACLRARGLVVRGELGAARLTTGKSNLTYRLWDEQDRWILRRPPTAGLTPSAHDVGREFRVMSALQGSGVPVPQTLLTCEDPTALGWPFTVVSFVDGVVLRTHDDVDALDDDAVAGVHEALLTVLVRLHALPYEDLGLGTFGKPVGFLSRQVRRWREQWDHVAEQQLPLVDQLHEALVAAPPTTARHGIVHGDFRVDNTLLELSPPRVTGLVDWEMATIGDPLTDVALLCAYQHPSFDAIAGGPAASTSGRWPSAAETESAIAMPPRSG